MKALIMYPIGLLLKAYLAYADILIRIKERKEQNEKQPTLAIKSTKISVAKQEKELQPA